MNLPPKIRNGGRIKVAELTQVEIWSWYNAVRELGTKKKLANRLGITEREVRSVISNLRSRQARADKRIALANRRAA